MAFGASRGDRVPVEIRRRGPRARAVSGPYGQGPALGVRVTPPAAVTGEAGARARTAAPAVQPPGRVRGSVRGVRGGASLDAQSLVARYRNLAVTSDATAAAAAGLVALAVRFGVHWPPPYVLVTAVLPAAWIALVALQHGYEARYLGNGPEEYRRAAVAALALFTLIAVASYVLRTSVSRTYVLFTVPVLLVLSVLGRHLLRTWIYRLRVAGQGLQRVLVVGRADAAVAVIGKLRQEPRHGLLAVAACVPPAAGVQVSHVGGVPVAGDVDKIVDAVDAVGAHVVAVVSHPDLAGGSLRRLSWALEERGVELIVSPGIVEVAGPRLSIRPVAGLSLLHLERPTFGGAACPQERLRPGARRPPARAGVSPLVAASPLAVRLTSRGPVLFRQDAGRRRRPAFTMLKFRSMVVDAEQRRAALRELERGQRGAVQDARTTRASPGSGALLRRYSLDELPQLINVCGATCRWSARGRRCRRRSTRYDDDARRRLLVKPGLTGLWQVSGRSDLSWEESVRLDLRYVDNWSMALDLLILWRTCRAVVRGAGAY